MKKRMWSLVLTGTLLLAGCGDDGEETKKNKETPKPTATQSAPVTPAPTAKPKVKAPIDETVEFLFSSGMGAWGTSLTLEKDGTFSGEFSDSNAGESGEGYVATVYMCSFSGNFDNFEKVDAYTYSMELAEIRQEETAGTEWIEDEVKYVIATPYGLEGGTEFLFFMPDTPMEMLPESFINWYPGGGNNLGTPEGTLGCYGIYNVAEEQGFFEEVQRVYA